MEKSVFPHLPLPPFLRSSSTSEGFQLCPSDACQKKHDEAAADPHAPPSTAFNPNVCPGDSAASAAASADSRDAPPGVPKFSPEREITREDPLVQQLEKFLQAEKIEIAGIEFIRDHEGTPHVFDCNVINTNYNSQVR